MTEINEIVYMIEMEKSICWRTFKFVFLLNWRSYLINFTLYQSHRARHPQCILFYMHDMPKISLFSNVFKFNLWQSYWLCFTGFLSTFFTGTVAMLRGSFGVQVKKSSNLEKGTIYGSWKLNFFSRESDFLQNWGGRSSDISEFRIKRFAINPLKEELSSLSPLKIFLIKF